MGLAGTGRAVKQDLQASVFTAIFAVDGCVLGIQRSEDVDNELVANVLESRNVVESQIGNGSSEPVCRLDLIFARLRSLCRLRRVGVCKKSTNLVDHFTVVVAVRIEEVILLQFVCRVTNGKLAYFGCARDIVSLTRFIVFFYVIIDSGNRCLTHFYLSFLSSSSIAAMASIRASSSALTLSAAGFSAG